MKMDPKNKTGVGFYLDSAHHRKIRKWCDEREINFFVFCRVAVEHLFFWLTLCPGDAPRDFTAFLKTFQYKKK